MTGRRSSDGRTRGWVRVVFVALAFLLTTAHSCEVEHVHDEDPPPPVTTQPPPPTTQPPTTTAPQNCPYGTWSSGKCRACPVGQHTHGSGCHETTPGHDDVNNNNNDNNNDDTSLGDGNNGDNENDNPDHGCTLNQRPDGEGGCEWNFQPPETATCPAGFMYDDTSQLCIPDPDQQQENCDPDAVGGCDPDAPTDSRACSDPRQTVAGSPDGQCYVGHGPGDERSEHCPAGQTFYSQIGCSPPCPAGQRFVSLDGSGTGLGTCEPIVVNNNPVTPRTPTLYVRGTTVDEDAGTVNFTVSVLPAATGAVTVQVATSDGTANAGSDYTSVSQTVTIPAGSTTATVPVPVLNDTVQESDETFMMTLSNPSSNVNLASTQSADTTITDDDASTVPTNISFTCTGRSPRYTLRYSWDAPVGGSVASYRMQLSRLSTPWASAQQISHFDRLPPTQTSWQTTQSAAVTYWLHLRAYLTSGTGDTISTSVRCSDLPRLTVGAASDVSEGSALVFPVSLSRTSSSAVTVNVATVAGTATAGTDYTLVNTTVTIPANTRSVDVSVSTIDDTLDEVDETVELVLSSPSSAAILGTSRATGRILDDDVPAVSLPSVTLTADEGGFVQVTASLDQTPVMSGGSVQFTTSGAVNGGGSCTTGADFYLTGTEFAFATGTWTSLTLFACDDTDTTDETVTITLSSTGISGLKLGTPTAVNVTISDATPLVSLPSSALTVDEGDPVTVTATLDQAPAAAASVRFSASGAVDGGGSCTTGADFYVSGTTFDFTTTTTTDTVTLFACNDNDNIDETVTLTLSSAGIVGLGLGSPASVVVTIDDTTVTLPVYVPPPAAPECPTGWHEHGFDCHPDHWVPDVCGTSAHDYQIHDTTSPTGHQSLTHPACPTATDVCATGFHDHAGTCVRTHEDPPLPCRPNRRLVWNDTAHNQAVVLACPDVQFPADVVLAATAGAAITVKFTLDIDSSHVEPARAFTITAVDVGATNGTHYTFTTPTAVAIDSTTTACPAPDAHLKCHEFDIPTVARTDHGTNPRTFTLTITDSHPLRGHVSVTKTVTINPPAIQRQ